MDEWSLVGKPALLVIHMQRSLCMSGGSLEGMGHCRAALEAGIIANIRALQDAFRAKGLPVVFVAARHPTEFRVPEYGFFWSAAAEMKINLEDSSDVDRYLREQAVETVVVTGVATGMAIGHNSFALADRFYGLIVPFDTCADANSRLHEAVLKWMLPPIALITAAEDVIAHL